MFFEKKDFSNCIRLALLWCILFYFPPILPAVKNIAFYLSGIIKTNNDNDNGVGGAVYSEDQLQEFAVQNGSMDNEIIEGIPEPEEFSAPQMLLYSAYKIQPGDMIGIIAPNFGLNQDTLISVNNISNTRSIQVGKTLRIPNQDGVMHKASENETLEKIAQDYGITVSSIIFTNELFSSKVNPGSTIFIPGAKLDSTKLQEINGDLFIWPISSRRITSLYGYRRSPFTDARVFHSGLDISANTGVPVKAAMSGRVTFTGYNDMFGNYIVISHHSNYRTLYGHLSVIRTRPGAYVSTGERIGDVGNTGQSTGSHLHFQVYKNGVTVDPIMLMN